MRKDIPKFVGCDARKDDMGTLDVRFDAVSICRSGCWVPAWCDYDFVEFVMDCPVQQIVDVEDDCMTPRDWEDAAHRTLEARRMIPMEASGNVLDMQIINPFGG